ncbi:hypothetical protein [Mycolicibacterium holsaticum]|jgi:uncharacterized membrane protein HdeD (DUF308 family)|uniref:Uncharacterized protein n=1 Tax=Mycolicibacterium holsaticum TaxID=152142 RepID=A0A1E3R8T1_9MYCO|nr:hypothetical protein [Mycolicibacterium holsaticum]MDA4106881.1 hypothetical protein [Mycolicibacterium holsaticum DSM 44478 = JCM 12374]ODQ86273.1 hypothetical protein BHQ17_21215 [Mycolicibacterium holsaticum]QZA14006.1 hypothetical protein K3U96_07790 [Mycolicibacterium holsaticum DSM 44478 = JCM 12374]UNC08533.1 hypothetical protein H5U41_19040 [Mycolicibacterium holsaticum DSM 44478 = JCM 12374]
MNSLVPPTVRQARWLILGGIFAIVLGVVRGYTFFAHGGLIFLMLGVVFLGIGVASVVASVQRLRLGDPPRGDTARR